MRLGGGACGKTQGHVLNIIVGLLCSCNSRREGNSAVGGKNGHGLCDDNLALDCTVDMGKDRVTGDVSGQDGRLRRGVRELHSAAVGEGQGGGESGAEEFSSHSHGLCEGVTGLDGRSTCNAVDGCDTSNRGGKEALEHRHVDG